jgi:hypothetical protein
MLELSYRQTARLWRRYREAGSAGLKHGNAGRPSNRGKPGNLRRRVLQLITQKYSGGTEERYGPTLDEGRWMQLHPRQRRYGPTRTKALVCEWEQGTIQVYYPGERIAFSELKQPRRNAVATRRPSAPW